MYYGCLKVVYRRLQYRLYVRVEMSGKRMEMIIQRRTSHTVLLNKCYGGEEFEKDKMVGHATRMRDMNYIYSMYVYAQKFGYAQTAGTFVNPVMEENNFFIYL